MATHSSILAWKIPWTEEPGSYSPWGRKESDMTEQLHFNKILCYLCVIENANTMRQYMHLGLQRKVCGNWHDSVNNNYYKSLFKKEKCIRNVFSF